MHAIAVQLKLINLYAHLAHNLCAKATFFQDHDMLGSIYEQADGFYDDVVERMIGLGKTPNIVQINVDAVIALKALPAQVAENKEYFKVILAEISKACALLEQEVKLTTTTEGTKQLLGGICDELEKLKYKLGQRVK